MSEVVQLIAELYADRVGEETPAKATCMLSPPEVTLGLGHSAQSLMQRARPY